MNRTPSSVSKIAGESSPARSISKNNYVQEIRTVKRDGQNFSETPEDLNVSLNLVYSKESTCNYSWVPSTESAVVAGRKIGGLVYVGTPPILNRHGYSEICRAVIDPSLSVTRAGSDKEGIGLPHWPRYSGISARCRATYLEWLASGRSDCSYNPGYMFLYFFGLERRFILDDPPEAEKREILEEVQRLRSLRTLYFGHESVRRYLGNFIEFEKAMAAGATQFEPSYDKGGWGLPHTLKLGIGMRIAQGESLSADWVLSWLHCAPEGRLGVAAHICWDELHALFKLRFEERFPDGLKVRKPRRALEFAYQAASGEFRAELETKLKGMPVPDIDWLLRPVEIAQEIADGVRNELFKLCRYLARNPEGLGSLEAHALLPQELWLLFQSEALEQLKIWARKIVENGGLVPVVEMVAQLDGQHPDKLTKLKLTRAADALARVGFGVAPDPRFALRSPKIGEPVIIFDLGMAVAQLEDVSETYRTALLNTALGTFVAHADGEVTESERNSLLKTLNETENLSGQERRRLIANLEWMLSVAPDLALLRRRLKGTEPDAASAIRSTLISAAHADGIVRVQEVAGIEKIYKAVGLDPALAYSDLHAGEFSDRPVKVGSATPAAAGKAIPADKPNGGIHLDMEHIASIHSETVRSSSVLGAIFGDTDAADDVEDEYTQEKLFRGLDAKHAEFVKEIVMKDHWTEDAFRTLCAQFSFLESGVLEGINEWAFKTYDDALLDEHNGFEVNPDIADALKKAFEGEGIAARRGKLRRLSS